MKKSIGLFIISLFLLSLCFLSTQAIAAGTTVKIPDVVGKTQAEAEGLLKSAGFQVQSEHENTNNPSQNNRVLHSFPAAGSIAAKGSLVRLKIGRDNTVLVPNVIGMNQQVAESRLRAAGLRVILTASEVFTEERDQKVVGCNPSAGTQVGKGTEVRITVGWKKPHTIPDVIGKSQEEAEKTLAAEKFRVVKEYENLTAADRAKHNKVIRIEPAVGTTTKHDGFLVKLHVGILRRITVPDVVKKSQSEATQILTSAGLKTSYITEPTDDRSMKDKVSRTSPTQGSSVEAGSEVRMYVAKIRRVRVPNFVGMTEADAKKSLQEVKLKGYWMVQETTDPKQDKKVIRISPAAGSEVELDSTVTLFIGKRNTR